MIKFSMVIFFFLFRVLSFSQETKLSEVIISIAEELAADDSDPEAVTSYVERLQDLVDNPVKLNSSREQEISRLFFLSDFQVKALIDYIHSSGMIVSVYEIINIPGFDRETTEMIIPFISLNNNFKINPDSAQWRNSFLVNLMYKDVKDTSWSGSPFKILTKYKFTSGCFSGGMTAEKDAGEKLLNGINHLPDFMSFYFAYNGNGIIRRVIIGDYSARFGQGTNINTGIRTGLSVTSPGYMASRNEIRQYTSTDENNFFRGMAAEFSIKNLGVSIFFSKNSTDATLGSSSGSVNDYIVSFNSAGLHSTPLQMMNKDAVTDIAYGINLSYDLNNVRIGLAWSEDRLSLPFRPEAGDPDALYDFKGDRNTLYTIYYNSLINRFLLYGEFSTSQFSGYAFIQGLSLRPSDRLNINFLFRRYDEGYFSFHGRGPGSSSATMNEQGILGNITFEAAKHLFISTGCDLEFFPWLRYRCSSPSRGVKQEIRARYLPTDRITFEALFNYRYSMLDDTKINGIPGLQEIKTRSLRCSVRYSLYDNLTIGTRLDYKVVKPSGSNGMLISQDFVYKLKTAPFTFWFRYCIFNTVDWDSRIYIYENDLLYSFNIPALSGEGSRSYLMVKWEIGKIAEMRLKYGVTSILKNDSPENRDEVRFQFKILF